MKDFHKKLATKAEKLDQKALTILERMVDDDLPRGPTLALLENLRDGHAEKGFLTEGQRKLIRKIKKDFDDFDLWEESAKRLGELYNDGLVPAESHDFIESIIQQWNENHSWTRLQREQIINILQKNDPKD